MTLFVKYLMKFKIRIELQVSMSTFVRLFVVQILLASSVYGLQNYKLEKVFSGFGVVWGMAFMDSSFMIITQRDGEIYKLNLQNKTQTKLFNIPSVYVYDQGGLLDVQVSPWYKKDGWIYFTYVKKHNNKGVTTLARAKLKENSFYDWQELLVTQSASDTGVHFGSRITFDKEGYIYFGVGDRGVRPNAQDIQTHAGTILRLHLDGSIPKSNPFVGRDGLDEIYSYGHRNPQGLFYDSRREILFECEHGPRGGDEINIIQKGQNYGWPTVSHGKEYWNFSDVGEAKTKKGMIDPIKVYTPSIAPSSLMVYSGKVFKQWEGDLFLGALVKTHLNKITLDENLSVIKEEKLFENLNQRIRNVVESPDGLIYFSTDNGDIYKIKP
jgi:aldose sugar dehydrogenase